ncbi:hypothetical protein [Patiriisocius hiemis]|uniref:SGNH/GDSL hydrolase family protein n=1 Tax=Patiriisocius hiemis TaxID=3075604 RepID=A0ABU2YEP6_9FLAO|nr:hypothetical protein [Constantimarinum sp. W242]MDT0556669.1 hypothetical protein [Constantimarinum sp. W242]
MQKRLLKYLLIFFIPLLLLMVFAEVLATKTQNKHKINSELLSRKQNEIKTIVLGSSQLTNGINPIYLDDLSINLSSPGQHHDSDFNILKKVIQKLPNLATVVLEVSYAHFEVPHNGPNFWKNNIYLKYYKVNNFNRKTYPTDSLLFISNTALYYFEIKDYYLNKSKGYNEYAFDTLNYSGTFKDLNYNIQKIKDLKVNALRNKQDKITFKKNTLFFEKIIQFLKSQNLSIILVKPPTYKTYLAKRNKHIVQRRDSFLNTITSKYPKINVLDSEKDTLLFTAGDYRNHNHLNPAGAKKLTTLLQKVLDSIN